jgi:hypothetical protein
MFERRGARLKKGRKACRNTFLRGKRKRSGVVALCVARASVLRVRGGGPARAREGKGEGGRGWDAGSEKKRGTREDFKYLTIFQKRRI